MAVPFISRDRRADLLSYLASESTEDAEDTKSSYNKLYTKEVQKDQKDTKDSKDTSDDYAPGGVTSGVDEIIRAAGADAAATDQAAGVSVGQKWVKPAKLEKRDPIV